MQVLASFPANFLFPIATAVLVSTGISLNWGGIVLMSLGAQWYILFNVIAGASSIPNDLREAAANLQLPRSLWWRRLILPAIFPSYVTGGITAAGGAWNASIVAEVVSYGSTTLVATGLGAYIARAHKYRRLAAHPHRRPGHEFLRRQPQPPVLAAPVCACAAPLLPLTLSTPETVGASHMTTPTTTASTGEVLIDVDGVSKSFPGAAGDELRVLDSIDLQLRTGEIVALLGRSGSGKSTLLRIIAGLIPSTSGSVRYRGAELNGANPGAALVFQSFALMPWLTVQDNVELGLAARRVPPAATPGTRARRDRHDRP